MVLYPESRGGAVSGVYRREAGEAEELLVGLCPHGEAQGGVIEEELRKLVRGGLDGVRVFHTLYRR